jgi:probable DNA metabolism protein
MPDGSNLVYRYDGSFDGLLCCVFESYSKKEIPSDILPPDTLQTTLFPAKEIPTELEKSNRVLASIPQTMGDATLDFVRRAFLTYLPQKEWYILMFLRMGYRCGPSVMNMLADDVVNTLFKAVKHLNNETQLLKGFARFSVINNTLVAEIEPKNFVLPLLTRHFCERYPEERFFIYDTAHSMALIYQPYQYAIIPVDNFEMPEPDEEEASFRELWRLFYKTIEIQGRHNPKCRMSHMPKRYWKYLTEFGAPNKSARDNGPFKKISGDRTHLRQDFLLPPSGEPKARKED